VLTLNGFSLEVRAGELLGFSGRTGSARPGRCGCWSLPASGRGVGAGARLGLLWPKMTAGEIGSLERAALTAPWPHPVPSVPGRRDLLLWSPADVPV